MLFVALVLQPAFHFAAQCGFTSGIFVGIVAVDAVMVIASGNSVVKEDIASKLEVRRAYSP